MAIKRTKRSPYMDALAKTRGEIRALVESIELHLNLHAACWKFARRSADAARLSDLFVICGELQQKHNEWERENT